VSPRIESVTHPTPEQAEILAKGWTYAGKPFNAAATIARHPRLLKRFTVFTGTFLTYTRCRPATGNSSRSGPATGPAPTTTSATTSCSGRRPASTVNWPSPSPIPATSEARKTRCRYARQTS
jgi:hypothetical protein